MGDTLFERYIDTVPRLWNAYVHHPWMDAIHDGTLSMERFQFFLAQDMPYQTDFLNALLLASTRSADPEAWLWLRSFIAAEAAFEASLLEEMGVPYSFDRWDAGPAREGYMNHLTRVALEGSVGRIGAALLPCAAGFTGAMAEPADTSVHHPHFRRWLEFYERPVQAEFSNRLVGVFEDAMRDAGEAEREQTRMIFVRSLQHQVEVFDAAWRLSDEWRVE